MFFRSHLLDVIDSGSPSNELGEGHYTSGVFHPGETIRIGGYFLNNSQIGSLLKMTRLGAEPKIELFSQKPCFAKS